MKSKLLFIVALMSCWLGTARAEKKQLAAALDKARADGRTRK